ncbi:MAG: tRNA (adenosine(37)-N6)-threonylcarbamoyltransferase complex dimerization subunit type 1 TsaB [Spirochaetales bacterium]|nr:tRNA (adenosine(37)-N6)-threonylcarbamoyltransferase complex dimerization subunit type 1 TsaB [Spirochaetales bacterium]|tara:strand:+ start:7263 stop:7922 length:660 start_codon:yes stop_codon:yes gene_type:complete
MVSLNIETSQNTTSVCLSSVDGILSCLERNNGKPNHCELLMPLIKELFRESSLDINDLTSINVNVGPGNLSSLRVGISTANVFGNFAQVPVYGIPSFLSYAFNYSYNNKDLIVLFDLKNNHFAYARFCQNNSKISLIEHNFNISLKDMDCIDTNDSIIVGTGLEKYKQINRGNLSDTLVIDKNFRASSKFLSKVDLNFQKELISNKIPLVPFNSYSFGS